MERRPLVILNGRVQELPVGDSVPAPAAEEEVYSKRTDFVGEDTIYKGEAVAGSAEASAVWRIRKLTLAVDGDVTETWASGNTNFDKIWNDRASLSYS